ncbi:hypothetical protein D3C81_1568330 [compost metagenome]
MVMESDAFCTIIFNVLSPGVKDSAGVKKVPSSNNDVCSAVPPFRDTLTLVALATLP